MNFTFLSLSVKQWFYVLDGQHSFDAVKLRCEKKRKDKPEWCVKFWCRVLLSWTSLENRQKIAGRQQAGAGNVKMTSMSDNLVTFWRYVKKEKDATPAPFYKKVKENGKNLHLCEITQSSQAEPPEPIHGSILCDEVRTTSYTVLPRFGFISF